MSQATVRATKREIRRAIGPEAIEAIDRIAKAGEGLAQIVADQQDQIARLQFDCRRLTAQADADREMNLARHASLAQRSFLARLRWLVRGT